MLDQMTMMAYEMDRDIGQHGTGGKHNTEAELLAKVGRGDTGKQA